MADYKLPDLVGYEKIIEFIEKHRLYRLEGDILEIGAFLGGGTVKLSQLAEKYNRKVFTVDIFSPEVDKTINTKGMVMAEIYDWFLQGKSQRMIFDKVTENCKNMEVIAKDSREVTFSEKQKFFFSFIDGNHDPEYVRSDFHLAWKHTLPGGVVAFHDYGGDLPQTTEIIDKTLEDYKEETGDKEELKEKDILFVFKKE